MDHLVKILVPLHVQYRVQDNVVDAVHHALEIVQEIAHHHVILVAPDRAMDVPELALLNAPLDVQTVVPDAVEDVVIIVGLHVEDAVDHAMEDVKEDAEDVWEILGEALDLVGNEEGDNIYGILFFMFWVVFCIMSRWVFTWMQQLFNWM